MVNSGILTQIFEELGANGDDLAVFAGLMVVYFAFFGIVSIVMYLLYAFGLYGMAKGAGIEMPWRGFIPFANTFLFGKIAERYAGFCLCGCGVFNRYAGCSYRLYE